MAYRDEENNSFDDEEEVEDDNKSCASENESGDENWAVRMKVVTKIELWNFLSWDYTTYYYVSTKKNITLITYIAALSCSAIQLLV